MCQSLYPLSLHPYDICFWVLALCDSKKAKQPTEHSPIQYLRECEMNEPNAYICDEGHFGGGVPIPQYRTKKLPNTASSRKMKATLFIQYTVVLLCCEMDAYLSLDRCCKLSNEFLPSQVNSIAR